MNQLFFLNVSVVLIGFVYVIRLACLRTWREYFASRFKPGTLMHNAYLRDMKPYMLIKATTGLVILAGCLVFTTRSMLRIYGDQAGSMVQGLGAGAVVASVLLLIMAYSMLKDK